MSFSYPRHPLNLSYLSSFCSYSSCKLTFIPWTVYPVFDSYYSYTLCPHHHHALLNDFSVGHRAIEIEVHYRTSNDRDHFFHMTWAYFWCLPSPVVIFFSLSIQLLLARWFQKIPSNIICTLMTPSCTSLSLLQLLLYLLKHLPPLSMTFSPGWTWTNCFSIHQKLNFFSLAQNNSISNFLI